MELARFVIHCAHLANEDTAMTTTTTATTTDADRQTRIVAKTLRSKSFATLATVSPRGRSHGAGVVYDFVDGALWVHTMGDGRKARNIAANEHVGVCIPYRRLPFGPPYTLHFQGVAELVALDDPVAFGHYERGALRGITGHGAMEMDGACFIRIVPRGTIHSFGPGVPILDLARDPLGSGARSAPAAAVLALA